MESEIKAGAARFPALGYLVILACLGLLLLPAAAPAAGGPGPGATADPMIRITALPMKGDLNRIMAQVSSDVSRDTGIKEASVTYYWQTFDAVYCPGCAGAKIKKPMFVDIYAPAFITAAERKSLLRSVAEALARHTSYGVRDIFISLRMMEKEDIYILGDVVTNWKQVGGPDR